MSPDPLRDRVRGVADRVPEVARRRAGALVRRVRSGRPQATVVVLLAGPEPQARQTLDTARDQPVAELDIVAVVMDDHLRALGEEAAGEDWRVRAVTALPGSDWAAARHFGSVQARAEWLLFLSPRQLLLPGAIETMLAERTADHVVLGSLSGAEDEPWARTPLLGRLLVPRLRWARALDNGERDGQSVAVALLVEGHHDVGRATLRDDVQRTRLFEKVHSPMHLLSGRVAQDRSALAALERTGLEDERRARAAGALTRDLPSYLLTAELCDDAGWQLLRSHAAELVEAAGDQLVTVPVEDRVAAWIAGQDRRAALTEFVAGRRFAGGQFPTHVTDGVVLADFDCVPDDLPDEVARLSEAETGVRAVVRRARLDDGHLLVELYAALAKVDQGGPEATARLVGPGTITLPTDLAEDPGVTRWMGEAHQRHDRGVVSVEIPVQDLTPGDWRLELELTDRDVRRTTLVGELDSRGSAARVLTDQGRELSWVPSSDGLRLRVAETSEATSERPAGVVVRRCETTQDSLVLELDAPDGATARLLGQSHVVDGRDAGEQWVFELTSDPWGLGRAPAPTGTYRLSVQVEGTDLLVTLADEVADTLPRTALDGLRRTSVWRGPRGGLVLRLDPDLADDEAGPYAQARLQEGYRAISDRVDPHLVYFQSFLGQAPTDHPAAIQAELQRVRPEGVRMLWAVADSSVRVPEGAESVLLRSWEWYDALARSAYVVTNIELDPWFTRREDQEVLETYHGYPSKAMGLAQWRTRGLTPSHLEQMLQRTSGTWNNLLTPIPEMDRYYRENYAFEGRIISRGYPRVDALVAPGHEERRAQTRERLGVEEHQRAVLYAPTWRDDLATNFRSAEALLHLDVEEAAHALGPDYVVLLRGHRFHTATRGGAQVVDVTGYPEVNDLILAADAAVLDYSSMRFDVALAGKPMVFLVPDLLDYTEETRGFLYDFARSAPGPLLDTTSQVVEALADLPALAEQWRERIAGVQRLLPPPRRRPGRRARRRRVLRPPALTRSSVEQQSSLRRSSSERERASSRGLAEWGGGAGALTGFRRRAPGRPAQPAIVALRRSSSERERASSPRWSSSERERASSRPGEWGGGAGALTGFRRRAPGRPAQPASRRLFVGRAASVNAAIVGLLVGRAASVSERRRGLVSGVAALGHSPGFDDGRQGALLNQRSAAPCSTSDCRLFVGRAASVSERRRGLVSGVTALGHSPGFDDGRQGALLNQRASSLRRSSSERERASSRPGEWGGGAGALTGFRRRAPGRPAQPAVGAGRPAQPAVGVGRPAQPAVGAGDLLSQRSSRRRGRGRARWRCRR